MFRKIMNRIVQSPPVVNLFLSVQLSWRAGQPTCSSGQSHRARHLLPSMAIAALSQLTNFQIIHVGPAMPAILFHCAHVCAWAVFLGKMAAPENVSHLCSESLIDPAFKVWAKTCPHMASEISVKQVNVNCKN